MNPAFPSFSQQATTLVGRRSGSHVNIKYHYGAQQRVESRLWLDRAILSKLGKQTGKGPVTSSSTLLTLFRNCSLRDLTRCFALTWSILVRAFPLIDWNKAIKWYRFPFHEAGRGRSPIGNLINRVHSSNSSLSVCSDRPRPVRVFRPNRFGPSPRL